MIDLNAFRAQWQGRLVDYDRVEGYQCTDLGKQWLNQNTNQVIGSMGNAIDWWNHPKPQLLSLCDRVEGSQAQAGDIVIKRPNHLGLATGNLTSSKVEILEQNGHTGNGKGQGEDRIRTRWINRSDVAGLYRFKQAAPAQTTVQVNSGMWNVRTSPQVADNVIKQANGNAAPALGGQHYAANIDANGWAQITFLNQTGYLGPKAFTKV